jgi:ferredoxin
LKIILDRPLCCSYGRCVEAVPSVFSFDAGDKLVIADDIPEVLYAMVRFACEACPAGALTAIDEPAGQAEAE